MSARTPRQQAALESALSEVRQLSGVTPSELEPLLKKGRLDVESKVVRAFRGELVSMFKRYLVENPELSWYTLVGAIDVGRTELIAHGICLQFEPDEDDEE